MPIENEIKVGPTTHYDHASCCPSCKRPLGAATCATGDDKPSEGDITICFYCGHIMAFADDQGALRDLTDDEMLEIAGHPTILKIQEARKLASNSLDSRNDTNSGRRANEEGLEDS